MVGTDEKELETSSADGNRVSRDYAFMRLECIERSDLKGVTEQELNTLASEFHSAQKALLVSLVSQADRNSEFQITVNFDKTLHGIRGRLQETIRKQSSDNIPVVNTQVNNTSNLPKIAIRPFDGRQESWVSFKHLFDSLIHKKEMPDVEKMHYLLTCVQGEAHNLIKSYPITEENYLLAYNVLLKHYDRKRDIALTYYGKLLDCAKSRNASDLGRICRTFSENLDILSRYNLPDRNFMLFQLLWSKLDSATREAYDMHIDATVDIPKYEDLLIFVEKKARAIGNSTDKQPSHSKSVGSKNKTALVVTLSEECVVCSKVGHPVDKCLKFLGISPKDRYQVAKDNGLCIRCLQPSHTVKFCRSKTKCSKCHSTSHHSLLHFERSPSGPSASAPEQALAVYSLCGQTVPESLFSTAVALARNRVGKLVPVRLLLDSASACNFVSKACAQRLGLDFVNHGHSVNGIGQVSTNTLGSVRLDLVPKNKDVKNGVSIEASVLSRICSDMPVGVVDASEWHHLKNLDLADPNFARSGPIDILVSVNVLASVLKPGLMKGSAGQPVALSTVFGWIVMGECSISDGSKNKNCFFVSNLALDNSIKRFWELEKVDSPRPAVRSRAEVECEERMEISYRRTPEGRMEVPLTFIDPHKKPSFRNSREIALKRFLNLEKKFKVNLTFRNAYIEFMKDYLEKGHMERVDPPSSSVGAFYYIPHHGVLRPDSVTTPLRTVFDASAADGDGRSLNDTLLPGPKLQNSIFDLLIRFRWHAVVFTGDIKQMYRQFLVSLEDTEYQRILWRSSPELPVQDFRLLTVTYGVSCAPYQALWCIARLAKEFASQAPGGAAVLQRDSYVDDVVSGAETVKNAVAIRDDLLRILSSAGLHLRKWTSNCQEFFEGLPTSDLYVEQFHNFEDIQDVSLKILGMTWLPSTDQLTFRTAAINNRCTKRSILSDIARIFDPLGLLSPVVFLAKYFMQLLWLSGVDWDDDAPVDIASEWLKFKTQLSSLSTISLPRRVVPSFVSLQFHGFCDASERGYCAVVYCRAICGDHSIVVRLCCAKSKVAPLRKRSVPRLELMAAVLLAELMSSVVHSLEGIHRVENVVAWSDSSVALTWIKSCPSRWKTFVANRVTEIQDNIPPDCWRHVSTTDNPADHGSRGLLPNDLTSCKSWWSGPPWLSRPQEKWPQPSFVTDNLAMDEQKILCLFTANNVGFVEGILARYSSFRKIVNILAFCLRAKHNLKHPKSRIVGPLSSSESNDATQFLVRHVQESVFGSEIRALVNDCPNRIPKSLKKLCPFVDPQGLLRVGGRLAHSQLGYDQKHPLLLPRNHRLTSLIIEEYHRRFLHPGLQTLQNLLVQDFWIMSAKHAIRTVLSSCIRCFRVKPRLPAAPLMGDLPAYRISQLKPFSSSAVDYAGPFDIALGRGRGVRTFKGYVCVFVCTATKAVHLELASELTSEAYLACLRRFMARRGRCSQLVSDQGRNFVGASNLLKDLMSQAAATERVEFVFNPPGSPHFSGLVEAGVKSMKTHLVRVVGSQRLTYEEFSTLLAQIEALLNSRPLSPLSSDPNDLTVLTPGHFLTMKPLTLLPEAPLLKTNVSVLQRWKMLQKMHQDFWRKWHVEYIHTLQQRHKWSNTQPNIEIGTLVSIVNEQCSPLNWKLGRVVQLHPGADNICRVATLRTAAGECKRPVVKLCPLPIPIDEDESVVSGSQ